jgi:hypothetical protein
MTFLSSVATTTRIIKLIMFNLLGCLFLWWLIIDDPRRKPTLVVLIPVMLLIDVVFIRRLFEKPSSASISLPIVYCCGSTYGVWWATHPVMWWKMLLLVVPFSFVVISFRRLGWGKWPKSDR